MADRAKGMGSKTGQVLRTPSYTWGHVGGRAKDRTWGQGQGHGAAALCPPASSPLAPPMGVVVVVMWYWYDSIIHIIMLHCLISLPVTGMTKSWYPFYHPMDSRRLSPPQWLLHTWITCICTQTVTHPSTNGAWGRVTSLIDTNILQLWQNANQIEL